MASASALCRGPGCLLEGGRECVFSSKKAPAHHHSLIPAPNYCSDSSNGAVRAYRQPSSLTTTITAAAQDSSAAAPRKGTRIFNFGANNKKKQSITTSTGGESPASPGTKLFRFGPTKKKQQPAYAEEEEEEAAASFGTKLFRLNVAGGKQKKEASASADASKGKAGQLGVLVPAQKAGTLVSFMNSNKPRRQDPKTVFVAGATGQIGARICQKLLREGFSVRGGVRDLFVAQQLAEFATQYGVVSREEAKRVNAVEFDFKNVESVAKAIGSAAKVVVTIGPSEDGPKAKVSFEDASNVIQAAILANVSSLVVVYEPSSGGGADAAGGGGINPLAGLTSFLTDLFSKPVAVSLSELLNLMADSQLSSYTLLKTSPSEGVDDLSPSLQTIDIRKEGTPVSAESAKISKSQIASVVAEVLLNPGAAENKVMEVFTSASATAVPISEQLSAIPKDGRREALAAARAKAEEEEREREARGRAEAEARAAVEEARRAAQLAAQLEAEAKQLAAEEARAASLAEKAQAQAAAAAASVDGLATKLKEIAGYNNSPAPPSFNIKVPTNIMKAGKPAPSLNFSLPAAFNLSLKPSSASPNPPSAAPTRPASPPPKRINKQREFPATPAVAASVPPSKPQVKPIFGGLFSQETVYIDEV